MLTTLKQCTESGFFPVGVWK